MQVFLTRLASCSHLGVISDSLMVSKFYNGINDPKGQENKIYTIVEGRKTFFCGHTVPLTTCTEVKYVLNDLVFGKTEL